MKTTPLLALAIGIIIGFGIAYFMYTGTIEEYEREIVILTATVDSLETEFDASCGPIVEDPEAIIKVKKSDADTYVDNFNDWLSSGAWDPAQHTRAYNLNDRALEAIRRHRLDPDIGTDNVRTYFALENVTTAVPATIYLVVYPLGADGKLVSLDASDELYMANLSDGFGQPCPVYCD